MKRRADAPPGAGAKRPAADPLQEALRRIASLGAEADAPPAPLPPLGDPCPRPQQLAPPQNPAFHTTHSVARNAPVLWVGLS